MNIVKPYINVKHHFCKFRVKQMINRRFKDYFEKIKLNNEEYNKLINLKQDIFKVLNAKDLNEANKLQDELISKNCPKNKFTDN